MKAKCYPPSHNSCLGLTTSDSYTMAWVSLVPTQDLSQPAWPSALDYVRSHQLEDGGWGDSQIYYAHDRVISTLAALWALAEWQLEPQDQERVARGADALRRYADDLRQESYETIGFELILPQLVEAVKQCGISVPTESFEHVIVDTISKMKQLSKRGLDCNRPRSWWVSAEGLPDELLLAIGDTNNLSDGVGCMPSATAACLRILRKNGRDSQTAFEYIDSLIRQDFVCQVWPVDDFEAAWTLDFYRRAQSDQINTKLVRKVFEQWKSRCGLGYSSTFPVIDGDGTAVAYTVLYWAGVRPDDGPLMKFWHDNVFYTYFEEYRSSVSAHINALTAFLQNGKGEHKRAAILITEWLRGQGIPLQDKWHISPFYSTSRLIPALINWDNEFAAKCIESLLEHQREDGGWGYRNCSTVEETSYVVLALAAAWHAGLLDSSIPLYRAKRYLVGKTNSIECLWIGKVLYQPIGVVRSLLSASRYALDSVVLEEHVVF